MRACDGDAQGHDDDAGPRRVRELAENVGPADHGELVGRLELEPVERQCRRLAGTRTTSTGQVTASLGTAQSAAKAIRVDAIVRAWAPSSAGGSGAGQPGQARRGSSSGSNTGEVWPVEQGGSARPTLELVLEVFD